MVVLSVVLSVPGSSVSSGFSVVMVPSPFCPAPPPCTAVACRTLPFYLLPLRCFFFFFAVSCSAARFAARATFCSLLLQRGLLLSLYYSFYLLVFSPCIQPTYILAVLVGLFFVYLLTDFLLLVSLLLFLVMPVLCGGGDSLLPGSLLPGTPRLFLRNCLSSPSPVFSPNLAYYSFGSYIVDGCTAVFFFFFIGRWVCSSGSSDAVACLNLPSSYYPSFSRILFNAIPYQTTY